MSSVECLRGFISERLTAAAEEIFGVFKKTIAEYEEEIDRQRKLLDIFLKPEIKLHRIELPQQHVCKEDEVLADQLLCNQERNSSLDQEDPEPPQIKEEQEEVCSSQEGEQLVLKQETDTFMLIPPYEESDHSEPESKSDHQLLSHNSHVAESQDQEGGQHGDSGSTRAAEPEAKKRRDVHSSEKPFKCDTCGKDFKLRPDLRVHLRVHTGEKPYSCQVCGRDFRCSSNMLVHTRTHTGEKPNTCKYGDSGSTRAAEPEAKNTHCKSHTNNTQNSAVSESHCDARTAQKGFTCDTCGLVLTYKSQFVMHQRVHTGEKPFACNTCGTRFSQRSSLTSHVRLHTGEKPFSCRICGKAFRCSSNMLVHMRNHTGEKPYMCNACGKRFLQISALKAHARIHTGEKLYMCNTCGRRFSQTSALSSHMRVHRKAGTLC